MEYSTVRKAFRLVASEFEDVPDNMLKNWISLTEPFVSRKRLGNLWAQALALLTAHRMKLAGVGAKADPLADVADIGIGGLTRVSSFSEGSTSVSFNNSVTQFTNLNAEYSLTPYGIQYLSLLRITIASITSAGEA